MSFKLTHPLTNTAFLSSAALSLGLALAGCGGSSDGPTTNNAGASTLAAVITSISPTYSITVITPDSAIVSQKGINKNNQVAGTLTTPNYEFRAFAWTPGLAVVNIDTNAAPDSHANAINSLGQVVGDARNITDIGPHAFSWLPPSGPIQNIDPLGSFSAANAVNDAGQVVGIAQNALGNDTAFSWTQAGGKSDLGTLAGYMSSGAYDVNAAGQIVGAAVNYDPNTDTVSYRAVSWMSGAAGAAAIDILGAAQTGNSLAYSINAAAKIAGVIETIPGQYKPFYWANNVTTIINTAGDVELGMPVLISASGQVAGTTGSFGQYQAFSSTPAGIITYIGTATKANAINSSGQVVGTDTSSGASRAFVWSSVSGMVDLNTRLSNAPAGMVLEEALAISDTGAIVVSSNQGLVLVMPPPTSTLTGNGSIQSPAGAVIQAPAVTGQAKFNFNVQYKKGAAIPTGKLSFQLTGVNFNATAFSSLSVVGNRAEVIGTGTYNNLAGYSFTLTAVDGNYIGVGFPTKTADSFRIVIRNPAGAIVYDNKALLPVSGSITL